MALTSQQTLTADQATTLGLAGTILKRHKRTSNSTANTAEQGVMELDDQPIKAGRLYEIYTNTFGVDSTVANDTIRANIRYTTDGSTPTTSSTLLNRSQEREVDAAIPGYVQVGGTYTPAVDETLSVILTTSRAGGSGSVNAVGSSSDPIELFIKDCGPDPGSTGVNL